MSVFPDFGVAEDKIEKDVQIVRSYNSRVYTDCVTQPMSSSYLDSPPPNVRVASISDTAFSECSPAIECGDHHIRIALQLVERQQLLLAVLALHLSSRWLSAPGKFIQRRNRIMACI